MITFSSLLLLLLFILLFSANPLGIAVTQLVAPHVVTTATDLPTLVRREE